MIYLTGFADEAADGLDGQIKVTKALGWSNIEARSIDGVNIHDLTDEAFDAAYGKLSEAGVRVNCFGSTIANWGKKITEPMDLDIEQVRRAIPRMQKLGAKLVRIMSYAVIPDRSPEDQMVSERVRRLKVIVQMFKDAGIQAVHENCMNYGGMGWSYTLRLLDEVHDLKLVFDTGNPVFADDRTKPVPFPKQSSWEFYNYVKDHVVYVHIKDGNWRDTGMEYTFCGEGQGNVKEICADLVKRGYEGGISIEPHLGTVFHGPDAGKLPEDVRTAKYFEYGQRIEKILVGAGAKLAHR